MLTSFQVLFAGTIKHKQAVGLWDQPQPELWPQGFSPSKCCFISVFPFLPEIKISLLLQFLWENEIPCRDFFFLWPFFPEALQAQRVWAMTVLPLLAALPLVIALSFPLFILPENRMEFTPPALLHNSTFVHRTQSFTFIKCAQTEMRSACCVSIPWLTMRGAGCFHKCPK